jgi:hypothetical protein
MTVRSMLPDSPPPRVRHGWHCLAAGRRLMRQPPGRRAASQSVAARRHSHATRREGHPGRHWGSPPRTPAAPVSTPRTPPTHPSPATPTPRTETIARLRSGRSVFGVASRHAPVLHAVLQAAVLIVAPDGGPSPLVPPGGGVRLDADSSRPTGPAKVRDDRRPTPAAVTVVDREPLDGGLLAALCWRGVALSALAVLAWWLTGGSTGTRDSLLEQDGERCLSG